MVPSSMDYISDSVERLRQGGLAVSFNRQMCRQKDRTSAADVWEMAMSVQQTESGVRGQQAWIRCSSWTCFGSLHAGRRTPLSSESLPPTRQEVCLLARRVGVSLSVRCYGSEGCVLVCGSHTSSDLLCSSVWGDCRHEIYHHIIWEVTRECFCAEKCKLQVQGARISTPKVAEGAFFDDFHQLFETTPPPTHTFCTWQKHHPGCTAHYHILCIFTRATIDCCSTI